MGTSFFEHPILNSPYEYPARHWELDKGGQPTNRIIERRRIAEFITPIPKPKKRKQSASQQEIVFDEGKGLSTSEQQYDPTPRYCVSLKFFRFDARPIVCHSHFYD